MYITVFMVVIRHILCLLLENGLGKNSVANQTVNVKITLDTQTQRFIVLVMKNLNLLLPILQPMLTLCLLQVPYPVHKWHRQIMQTGQHPLSWSSLKRLEITL